MKPKVYYDPDCNFHPDNLALLSKHFEFCDMWSPICIIPPTRQITQGTTLKVFALDEVKIIVTNSTSSSHILLKDKVEVINLEGEKELLKHITSTAEHTFGLILALTRNIVPAAMSVMDGEWDRYKFGGKKMLSDTSLGIVGFGRLGKMVARIAIGFGMSWSCCDPYIPHEEFYGERSNILEEVIKEDIVTFHIPSNEETRHMISYDLLSRMKKGSYLINTSHGDILDEEALLYFLRIGHLAGAALDCVPYELDGFPEKLVEYAKTHPNLLITPHIGGSTEDAWYMTQRRVIEKLIERYVV